MTESSESSPRSLGRVLLAGLVLLVAGYVLLKIVIGVAIAIAGTVAVILAIVAVIWGDTRLALASGVHMPYVIIALCFGVSGGGRGTDQGQFVLALVPDLGCRAVLWPPGSDLLSLRARRATS